MRSEAGTAPQECVFGRSVSRVARASKARVQGLTADLKWRLTFIFLFFIAIAYSNIESSPATFESYRARARSASSSRTSVPMISR